MRWLVTAPFIRGDQPGDWIPNYIEHTTHRFEYVPARYDHDRSRSSTSASQWADYLKQAAQAWFRAGPWRTGVGHIAVFPQLPVMLGIIKRLCFSKRPILATMFNLGQTYGGIKGAVARFGLASVDIFMVHSTAEIDNYSRWLEIPPERFMFIPLSIKMRSVTHGEAEAAPYVFAMGTANRDYRLLFEAAAQLGYKAIVVAGEYATRGLKIPDNVTVLRDLSLEECHRLSQQARVNVVPVDNAVTASGQVTLLETMMYGKAVVATRCVGTADYVDDGVTVLSIPPQDLTAMVDAIRRLWEQPELRQRLGAAAQAYIHEKVSFKGVSSILRQALDRLDNTTTARHPR